MIWDSTGNSVSRRTVAVNPASQTAYFAVRVAAGGAKKDVLLSIDGNGKVKEVALDNVKFVAVPLNRG